MYHDEKSVLVHEAAHAVLDVLFAGRVIKGNRIVQASPMRALDDEAIGFLAGAFYLVSAGAAGSSQLAPAMSRSMLKSWLRALPVRVSYAALAWRSRLAFS